MLKQLKFTKKSKKGKLSDDIKTLDEIKKIGKKWKMLLRSIF